MGIFKPAYDYVSKDCSKAFIIFLSNKANKMCKILLNLFEERYHLGVRENDKRINIWKSSI